MKACYSVKKNKNLTKVLLIGAPNTGKSTIFNHLTNSVAMVGNYDRTTVSTKMGKIKKQDHYLMDFPGIYTLSGSGQDDALVINELFFGHYKSILNVVNANSFLRDLHLTVQLLEMNKPLNIVINAIDELKNQSILKNKISFKLKTNVNLISAKKNIGLTQAKNNLVCPLANFKLEYDQATELKIDKISNLLESTILPKRFVAVQLLQQNQVALETIKKEPNYLIIKDFLSMSVNEIDYQKIYLAREMFINKLYEEAFIKNLDSSKKQSQKKWLLKVDKLFLKRLTGLPIFILVLTGVYYITFGPYTGGYISSQIDYLLNDYLLTLLNQKMTQANLPFFFISLICDGFFAGFFALLPFIPYILILFFFVGLFQQSGYLARVSILTDQLLEPFGLSGRSIINMISGMGCNVPAIMMARSSFNKKEKYISIFIAPFISCSARATVFSFVASLIFANNIWLIVFLLQLFSGLIALLVGLIFSKTMFRKRINLFLVELPKWRSPDFLVIGKLITFELKQFLLKIGKFVLLGSLIIWLLTHLGVNGFLSNGEIEQCFIAYIGKGLALIFYPIGLNDWRITTSLLLAFPAKELAVTNLIIIFHNEIAIRNFFSLASGLSYMVFFLFYIPCLTTMVVFKKETRWKTLFLNLLVSFSTAYFLSAIVYWSVTGITMI